MIIGASNPMYLVKVVILLFQVIFEKNQNVWYYLKHETHQCFIRHKKCYLI